MLWRAAQGIDPSLELSPEETQHLMKLWHNLEPGGLNTRLKAMRMFPYFFSPPPTARRPRKVDATPMLDCLKIITETTCEIPLDPAAHYADRVWNEGGPTRLMLAMVNSHAQSFAKDDGSSSSSPQDKLMTPLLTAWSGLSSTLEIYLHSVLDIAGAGEPIDRGLLRRILLILKRDIDQTRDDMRGTHGRLRQSFCFWKVFTAVFTLARSQSEVTEARKSARLSGDAKCEVNLEPLRLWFEDRVREWSRATEVTDWAEAKDVLMTISWPTAMYRNEEELAGVSWYWAILKGTEACI